MKGAFYPYIKYRTLFFEPEYTKGLPPDPISPRPGRTKLSLPFLLSFSQLAGTQPRCIFCLRVTTMDASVVPSKGGETGTEAKSPPESKEVVTRLPHPHSNKVIVSSTWNAEVETQMGSLLLEAFKWCLPVPELIISVTGGADRAKLTRSMQKEFRRGLLKAASSTEAWIVTGGTGSGVMEQVGLAARAQRMTSGKEVPLIGIAPFAEVDIGEDQITACGNSTVARTSKVKTQGSNKTPAKAKTKLDRNHSHFILVDTPATDKESRYEDAIDFRVEFEKSASRHFKKHRPVPIVLIMFEGGKNTLRNVQKALEQKIPVVIIKGSGRAADVLACAYEETGHKNWDDSLEQKIDRQCTEKNIEKGKLKKCAKCVWECLNHRERLTVFELTSHTSVYDVDRAVLKALLNAKRSAKDQTRLAIIWNRFDIAVSDIDIQSLKEKDLKHMTRLALSKGRADFLDLFLDINANLEDLSTDSLADLFLASETDQLSVLVAKICQTWKKKLQEKGDETRTERNEKFRKQLEDLLLKMIGNYGFHDPTSSQSQSRTSVKHETPKSGSSKERNYLLWAVLMNRMDLAYIFWKEGKEKILAALVVNMTLKAFAECKDELDTELKARFQQQAEKWGERAGELLLQCHEVDEDKTRRLLVLESHVWGNSSCVLTALRSDNKRFTSLHPCRSLRRLVWKGQWPAIEDQDKSSRAAVRGQHTAKVTDSENQENVRILQHKMTWAPRTVFRCQWLAYLGFLTLYSYMVLVEMGSHFTWVEILITVWVFAIAVDVGVQFKRAMERPLGKAKDRLLYHLSSPWTVLDLVSILAFVVGLAAWASAPGPSRDAGRVILALDLIVFFLRFLYFFTINRYLGPKLVMFGRMLSDLALLSIILFVFIFGYAIASEAILYPNTALKAELLYSVPRKAFGQIFGEFFLEEIEGTSACSSDPSLYLNGTEPRCPSSYGRYVVPILMAVYILITHLLLLNLFIAMFTHTFTQVQQETDEHWQFLRLRGVYEMSMRSPPPAPFNLLYHLWNLSNAICHCRTEDPNPFQMKFQERQDLIEWEDAVADTFLIDKCRKPTPAVDTPSSLLISNTTASSSDA